MQEHRPSTSQQLSAAGVEMSIAVTGTPPAARRVRHQAREVVAVMAFSLASSVVLTLVMVGLMALGSRG
jgi:hypothetical protein